MTFAQRPDREPLDTSKVETCQSWTNQLGVGGALPPLPSPPDPYEYTPSICPDILGSMFPFPDPDTDSQGDRHGYRSGEKVKLAGSGTIQPQRLMPVSFRVWIRGIPTHWTLTGLQKMIAGATADPTASLAVAPGSGSPIDWKREGIMPDGYYPLQKWDCVVGFKDRSAAECFLAVFPHSLEYVRGGWFTPSSINGAPAWPSLKAQDPQSTVILHVSPSDSDHRQSERSTATKENEQSGPSTPSPTPMPYRRALQIYDSIRPYGPLKRFCSTTSSSDNDLDLSDSAVISTGAGVNWIVNFLSAEDARKFQQDVNSGVWQSTPLVMAWNTKAWKITTVYPDLGEKSNQGKEEGGSVNPPVQLPPAPSPPTPFHQCPAPTKTIQSATIRPFPFPVPVDTDTDNEAEAVADPDEEEKEGTPGPYRKPLLLNYAESLPKDGLWEIIITQHDQGAIEKSAIKSSTHQLILKHRPGRCIVPYESGNTFIDLATLRLQPLAPDVTSHFLKDLFSAYGQVVSVKIMLDPKGRARGFGFISYTTPEMAAKAKARLDNKDMMGSKLSVRYREIRMEEVCILSNPLPIRIKTQGTVSQSASAS